MSEVELLLAFLAGVLMGGAVDRFVLPLLVDACTRRDEYRRMDKPPSAVMTRSGRSRAGR